MMSGVKGPTHAVSLRLLAGRECKVVRDRAWREAERKMSVIKL